jgi:hypothetical protein
MPEIGITVAVVVAILMLRHYAARQIAARRGRFVWAFAVPMLIGPPAMMWSAVGFAESSPRFAVLLFALGLLLLVVLLRFFTGAARAISATRPDQDLVEVLGDKMTDGIVGYVAIMLMIGIVLGVVAVILAAINR